MRCPALLRAAEGSRVRDTVIAQNRRDGGRAMAGRGGVLAAALLAALPLAAQTTETIEVRSRSRSDEAFLAGNAAPGEPVTLTGRLNLPGDAGP
jgi:hypothetical protein